MRLREKARYTLIPGSAYRVNFQGQEKELVFDGRTNRKGIGFLQWHDVSGESFLNRLDDKSVFVVQSFA